MDPNAQPPTQPTNPPEQNSTLNKASQVTGEYIHNNYETWIRKLFGFLFMILNFIRSTIMQIIAQVFSR